MTDLKNFVVYSFFFFYFILIESEINYATW